MENPLNPQLYRLLEKHFGKVKVAHQGVGMRRTRVVDPLTGRERFRAEDAGEYYAVCCPFCGDTRFRLWINHRWGVRDELGSLNLHLAHCYNEPASCLRTMQDRKDFLEDLTAVCGDFSSFTLARAGDRPPDASFELPGDCVLLSSLTPPHPALDYLTSRERPFDPAVLSRSYRVCWCRSSSYSLAENRIIVPVFQGGVLKGWQARYPGELDWKKKGAPPKYWGAPRMQKRSLVYNIDRASAYGTVAVCEGVTDVWSFGSMAVALLGCSLSEDQLTVLTTAAKGSTFAVLLDADKAGKKAVDDLARRIARKVGPGRVAVVGLPDGKDPGSLPRAYLRSHVQEAMRAAGVPVSFLKRGEGGDAT